MKLLDVQRLIFAGIGSFLIILLGMWFVFSEIVPLNVFYLLVPIVLVVIFLFGLSQKKRWAFHFGFALLALAVIASLWWQTFFKETLLVGNTTFVTWLAIINMIQVSLLLTVLIGSLYIQLALRKELTK